MNFFFGWGVFIPWRLGWDVYGLFGYLERLVGRWASFLDKTFLFILQENIAIYEKQKNVYCLHMFFLSRLRVRCFGIGIGIVSFYVVPCLCTFLKTCFLYAGHNEDECYKQRLEC